MLDRKESGLCCIIIVGNRDFCAVFVTEIYAIGCRLLRIGQYDRGARQRVKGNSVDAKGKRKTAVRDFLDDDLDLIDNLDVLW